MLYLISNDIEIQNSVHESCAEIGIRYELISTELEPCEILSDICVKPPKMLIIDDDALEGKFKHLIVSMKKICREFPIIFLTSDTGLEKGREISPLGIYYYGIKPILKKEIIEIIKPVFI